VQQYGTYDYHIYALTRDPTSQAARSLLSIGAELHPPDYNGENLVELAKGDLDDEKLMEKVFENVKPWGVFTCLAYPGLGADASGEERQGKMLADLSLKYGVECFIYSSATRAGPKYEDLCEKSALAKSRIERHCRDLGDKEGLPWTIIRPGFFFENFDDFIGSMTYSVLKSGLKKETAVGFIGAEDIGRVAAAVFRDNKKYKHKVLCLCSEFLTMSQLEESHQRAVHRRMPSVPGAFAWIITRLNNATQDLIRDLERNHLARAEGSYVEIDEELRLANEAYKMRPHAEYIMQRTDEGAADVGREWNGLSLKKLLTGRL
jgi:nucleoside-diphosphate-sugar epimerase